ncbi:sex peptide receptor-like [Mercenaria mercenaria]|uniref:sex peptide receptor-like n=1 Tax=Mercenaria mercenaria TaxID=6596 RepID=UPI001E1D357D|nr:sex peptide receptor-like [Mercenaria mercenaria]
MDQKPEHLNVMFSPEYAVPVFGYAVPPLALVILFVNFLMVWILLKRHMRSPANTLLICIAISDTLAIVLPVIPFVYFYTFGFYEDFIPFAWCRVFFNLVHVFPLLCNMASLWSTVALAFMRCFSVWRPLHAKSTITLTRTYITIIGIYILSALVYTPAMFEYTYIPLSSPSLMDPNTTIISCHLQQTRSHLSESFCNFHTWIQIIFTSLLPWFLITFPDFGLLYKLKKTEKERKTLTDESFDQKDDSKGKDLLSKTKLVTGRRMTSWMIFVVVSMIWLVEIPFAVSFTLYQSHTNGDVMRNHLGSSVVFILLIKYISYPVMFLIYCFMSQKFRKTFSEIVFCSSRGKYSPESSTKTYKDLSSDLRKKQRSNLASVSSEC